MPSGKGTYGNQVGRPPKDIYSGAMQGAMVGGVAGAMPDYDLGRFTGIAPGAIGGGAAGAIGGMAAPTIESLLNSGSITPQQAQLMRGTQADRRQVDQEIQQRQMLGGQFTEQEANRNNDLRQTLGAQFTEQEALARALRNRPMQNLGNPTSRSYEDPEIDAALLRQQQLDRFQR